MMCRRVWFLLTPILLIGTLLSVSAFGQAGQTLFDYKLKSREQTDRGAPVLILEAREYIKKGSVKMKRSDGKVQTTRIGSLKPGQQKRIPFRQPTGKYSYEVLIEGVTQFDQTITMSLKTDVIYIDPIKLSIDPDSVDVGKGTLIMHSNVELEKVMIEVFNDNGDKVVDREQPLGGKKGKVHVNWTSPGPKVGAIRLTAHDIAGFWTGVILEPFWVEIPHDDIVFDFGKDTWAKSETPKLKSTVKLIKDAMAKHKKKGLKMSMYVAGYTDTVGGASENVALSKARARAIGKWFKKNGLKIDVYYQGFGESVLAVNTPDNTPNPENRRAVYVLGNSPPPTSGQIPKSNWKRL